MALQHAHLISRSANYAPYRHKLPPAAIVHPCPPLQGHLTKLPDRSWLSQVESERSFLERAFLRLCHYLMDLKEVLATNLRRERHAQKLTQEELADRAGLSARYLGSIERAAVSASVTVLGHLARALSVSPCDLIHQSQRKKRAG
jgi:DNA-binding XRE family transcriptional regulator